MLGLGVTGTVVADGVFARQFAQSAVPVELPDMVYDAELQMMVDPVSRQPVYVRSEMLVAQAKTEPPSNSRDEPTAGKDAPAASKKEGKAKAEKVEGTKAKATKRKPLPTVTAGCDKCPKCDDHCG